MLPQRNGVMKVAEEKLGVSRRTRWVFRMWISLFLLLVFSISIRIPLYSQGNHHIYPFAGGTTYEKASSTMIQDLPYPYRPEHSITCKTTTSPMDAICPSNYPPKSTSSPQQRNTSTQATCPDYFRWIHEDLKPWKKHGITQEMLEEIERNNKFRHFRLIIVNGTAYVKMYANAFQTRDTFTLWGVLQLLMLYPGKLPDVDLFFQCSDKPSIRKGVYEEEKIPPLFHYCGSEDTYDIAFPDWSFWGWPETKIKPWASLKKDLEEGNKMMNWTDREPYAFWRGGFSGERRKLCECNSTKDWNALIYEQDWRIEIRQGFKNSDITKQCTHKYKIYMEGNAWSVSEKYILACDSMTLLVTPFYYEFFTRDLIPMKHYWPVDPNNMCKSIQSAVEWGNHNPEKAQAIGREGTKFIEDRITMGNVYDYMFHLLSEYGKLLRFKPIVPPDAVELCSEFWVCPRNDIERAYKLEVTELGPAIDGPCMLPPPVTEFQREALKVETSKGFMQGQAWEAARKPIII